jgi:hypothetical protein
VSYGCHGTGGCVAPPLRTERLAQPSRGVLRLDFRRPALSKCDCARRYKGRSSPLAPPVSELVRTRSDRPPARACRGPGVVSGGGTGSPSGRPDSPRLRATDSSGRAVVGPLAQASRPDHEVKSARTRGGHGGGRAHARRKAGRGQVRTRWHWLELRDDCGSEDPGFPWPRIPTVGGQVVTGAALALQALPSRRSRR